MQSVPFQITSSASFHEDSAELIYSLSTTNPIDVGDWASAVSAIVAVLALALAGMGTRMARKSLLLSERQEQRREERLEVFLLEAFSKRKPHQRDRPLACAVLVSNPSESANTLLSADLHVSLLDQNGTLSRIKIRSSPPQVSDGSPSLAPLTFPTRIESRGGVSGLIEFYLPDAVINGRRIDRYLLVVTDSRNRTESVEISIFRDMLDEEAD